jgi:hypothetical protein
MENKSAILNVREVTNYELYQEYFSLIENYKNDRYKAEQGKKLERILADIQRRNLDEKTFLVEHQYNIIIDIDTLFSKHYHFDFLDEIVFRYPLKSLLPVKQYVFEWAFKRAAFFSLFYNISQSFLKALPKEKLQKNFEAGSSYTSFKNYDLFQETIKNISSLNTNFKLYILVLISNWTPSSEGVGFFLFECSLTETRVKLADKLDITINTSDTIKMTHNQIESQADSFSKYEQEFAQVFNQPLPLGEKEFNSYENFIHYVNFSFELVESVNE